MIPGSTNQLLAAGVGYQISRSVRLRSSASAFFSRTPASAGNRKTWTWSGWVKRGLGSTADDRMLFSGTTNGTSTIGGLFFNGGGESLRYIDITTPATFQTNVTVTPVYRDFSAWYHIVLAVDTTQATAANRIRFFVNGVEVTTFATTVYPSQNADTFINAAQQHRIGTYPYSATGPFDGYLTEINFIDGQALTPSSFGETNPVTGVWRPKKYVGTYGTNGFYLNFSDNSAATAAAIGKDSSGNGNNWTPNNISVTAGATYDSMLDVPTPWGDGGNGRGNYAVFNAVSGYSGLPLTAANIQTSAVPSGGNWYSRSATMGISSGKWYAEFSMPSITSGTQGNPLGVGIIPSSNDFSAAGQLVGDSGRGYGFYCPDTAGTAPAKRVSGTNTSVGTGTATTTSDVFMVAFDLTNGNAWFGKNGTWYAGDPSAGTGASITGIVAGEYLFGVSIYRDNTFTNNTVAINFGQRPFAYTPPTGFKALNTQNLPDSTIKKGSDFFNIALAAGASIKSAAEALFTGDELVWVKDRANANNHQLFDTVRGLSNVLQSNTTAAETTYSAPSGNSVGWAWKESATAGFDIVTGTAPASGNFNVSHNLGVTPAMIILKDRTTAGTAWAVWHKSLATASQSYLQLNNTNAVAANTNIWGNTAPTSTQFTTQAGQAVIGSANYVAYLFSEVAGFSKFGSYTGNGSADGPFVFCGFRPKFVLWKRTDTGGYNWNLYDTSRSPYNLMDLPLAPNISDAESVSTSNVLDGLSNGFKVRGTSVASNANGGTYIYAAFAEVPFRNALAR